MHTPAPPKTMQQKIHSYNNVVQDIKKIFLQKIKQFNWYRSSMKMYNLLSKKYAKILLK